MNKVVLLFYRALRTALSPYRRCFCVIDTHFAFEFTLDFLDVLLVPIRVDTNVYAPKLVRWFSVRCLVNSFDDVVVVLTEIEAERYQ